MKNNEAMTPSEQMFAETEMIARATIWGLPVDVNPEVAEHMGAFKENAIDADEAEESLFDVDFETGIIFEDFTTEAIDGEKVL